MIESFMKIVDDKIIFTGKKLSLLISENFIKKKLAVIYGEKIEMFGLCDAVLNDNKKEVLNIPSIITVYPHDVEKQLIDGEKYHVANFYNGDKFTDLNMRQDSTNVEIFLNILFSGDFPKNLKYSDILKTWLKNLSLNDVNIGTSSTILEVIIAEVCRAPGKPEIKFANVIGKDPKMSELGMEFSNIRNITAQTSTFGALTFEDMDQMIISSVNMNKYNKEETPSPMEQVIKM